MMMLILIVRLKNWRELKLMRSAGDKNTCKMVADRFTSRVKYRLPDFRFEFVILFEGAAPSG